jgi:hypothetical protein
MTRVGPKTKQCQHCTQALAPKVIMSWRCGHLMLERWACMFMLELLSRRSKVSGCSLLSSASASIVQVLPSSTYKKLGQKSYWTRTCRNPIFCDASPSKVSGCSLLSSASASILWHRSSSAKLYIQKVGPKIILNTNMKKSDILWRITHQCDKSFLPNRN